MARSVGQAGQCRTHPPLASEGACSPHGSWLTSTSVCSVPGRPGCRTGPAYGAAGQSVSPHARGARSSAEGTTVVGAMPPSSIRMRRVISCGSFTPASTVRLITDFPSRRPELPLRAAARHPFPVPPRPSPGRGCALGSFRQRRWLRHRFVWERLQEASSTLRNCANHFTTPLQGITGL